MNLTPEQWEPLNKALRRYEDALAAYAGLPERADYKVLDNRLARASRLMHNTFQPVVLRVLVDATKPDALFDE